jgi:hypothetical protein
MAYKQGKNTLLKKKPNKLELREARKRERAEIIAKSRPIKVISADPKTTCPQCGGP